MSTIDFKYSQHPKRLRQNNSTKDNNNKSEPKPSGNFNSEKERKIGEIYNLFYDQNFEFILTSGQAQFLSKIKSAANVLIGKAFAREEIGDKSVRDAIEKVEGRIEKKYEEERRFLTEQYNSYKSNPNSFHFLSHFRKHCPNSEQIAYHYCNNKEIGKLIVFNKEI